MITKQQLCKNAHCLCALCKKDCGCPQCTEGRHVLKNECKDFIEAEIVTDQFIFTFDNERRMKNA